MRVEFFRQCRDNSMPALRNLRHEAFVREYLAGGVVTDAYAAVYKRASRRTAAVNGSALLKRHAPVRARLAELQAEWLKKSDITIERILTDYQEALDLAKAQQRPNDIVNAATAQAKLVGLLKDRVENTVNIDENMSPEDIIKAVAKEAGPEAAQAFANALGIDWGNSAH